MSDHFEPQSPNTSKPSSFEEIFGLGPNSQASQSPPPRSLEEIFGLDPEPVAPIPEILDWFDFGEPQPQVLDALVVDALDLEKAQPPEVSQAELELPELDLPKLDLSELALSELAPSELDRKNRILKNDEEKTVFSNGPFLSTDHTDSTTDPVNPPVMMDLNLNLDEPAVIPPSLAEVPLGDSQLFEQASQGDEAAIRSLLDRELVDYGAAVVEIELRDSLLQISVASGEVPSQEVIDPLVKTVIAQLNLAKIQKVSLYGQKHGSELPFWRSEFDPSDPTLGMELPDDELQLEVLPLSEQSSLEPSGFDDSGLEQAQPFALDHFELTPSGLEHTTDELPAAAETEVALSPAESLQDEGLGCLEVPTQEHIADPWLHPLDPEGPEPVTLEPATVEEIPDGFASTPSPVDAAHLVERREAVRSFLERYAAGERGFAQIDLSETDLSGINLTLADLHRGSFVWANLQDASLYHVNLSEAKLRHANLNGAKLRSANLQAADFLNADLKGADLSWSDLRGANLTGADLSDANLKNAILERVTMPDGTLLD